MIPEILKKHKLVPASLVVIILVIITYAGTLRNSFVSWDDYAYVIDNKLVRNSDSHEIGRAHV